MEQFDSYQSIDSIYNEDNFSLNFYLASKDDNQFIIYNFVISEKDEYTISTYCGESLETSYSNQIQIFNINGKGDNYNSINILDCNSDYLFFTYSFRNTEQITFMISLDLRPLKE